MAKGRELTTSRSERLLGSYNYRQNHGTVNVESEFVEDDVWSAVDTISTDGENNLYDNSSGEWNSRTYMETNMRVSRTSHRRGGDEEGHVGGLSLAFEDPGRTSAPRIVHQIRGQDYVASPRGRQMATSAPINVPDWSKIYRVDSVESMHDSDDWDDRDFDMVPPHEYLARSRNSAATSVFEGVGRTLKGRDMSRVRDAVWSQTGFDG